jgi:hypothetical protein
MKISFNCVNNKFKQNRHLLENYNLPSVCHSDTPKMFKTHNLENIYIDIRH